MFSSATIDMVALTMWNKVARLYGLPKTHQTKCNLRPVLDMSQSPYHSVAQWLTIMLEATRAGISKHCLRNLFGFIECNKERDIWKKCMISLEFFLLFKNVPSLETLHCICANLGDGSPILIFNLKELILHSTFNIQFLFNEKFYTQKY